MSKWQQMILIINLVLLIMIIAVACIAGLVVWTNPNLLASLLGTQPTPTAIAVYVTPTPTAAVAPTQPPPTPTQAIEQPSSTPTATATPQPSTATPQPPTATPQPPTATLQPPTATSTPSPTPETVEIPPFGLLSPEDVSQEVGTTFLGSGCSLYYCSYNINLRDWRCRYADTSGGRTTKPRLYGQNNGQLQLFNFQPNETLRLYVIASTAQSKALTGWQVLKVNPAGQLNVQLTGLSPDKDYVYVVLGETSGEVVNAIGYAPCGSIQDLAYVVPHSNTNINISDQEGNVIGSVPVASGTRMPVFGSWREDLDNLWWFVSLDDETKGWVRDDQVVRVLGPRTYPTPTPTPFEGDEITRPSPEQAVREYYALIEQREYEITWNKLTDYFKSIKNATGYGDYLDWWNSVKEIRINDISVIDQNDDFARLWVDITYIRFSLPPYSDPNFQIDLIWDQASNQWMFYDTKSQ